MEGLSSTSLALLGLGLAALAVAAFVYRARSAGGGTKGWRPRIRDDEALATALERIAGKHGQPALAAALVHRGEIVARAAVGRTVAGGGRPVDLESRFHLGSTTKGVTALLVALLVREGRLRYDTTLGSVLGGVPMRDEYEGVTVRDLLLHRAGVMAMQDTTREDPAAVTTLWSDLPARVPDPGGQRREMAKLVLALPPIAPVRTKHVYSNVGFGVLGLVAETAAGESFESLVAGRIFGPLGMKTARLGGWPCSAAEPDQPRGHYVEAGRLRPQPLDDEYAFPAWMNPAGGLHCGIEDFARYAREVLLGRQGQGTLLDRTGYEEMHAAQATVSVAEMYGPSLELLTASYGTDVSRETVTIGYGWGVVATPRGDVSVGDGSGGTFFARVVVFPALDAAFVGATTTGAGAPALGEAIEKVTGLDWK